MLLDSTIVLDPGQPESIVETPKKTLESKWLLIFIGRVEHEDER